MTEADIRKLSRWLNERAVVVWCARDRTKYGGCALALRVAPACGCVIDELVVELADGTKKLVDLGEIVQARAENVC